MPRGDRALAAKPIAAAKNATSTASNRTFFILPPSPHAPAGLGLATGSTPIGIYRELIKMHHEGRLDFSDVVTFNLDEYYPMKPESIHSYHRFMRENLFNHINVKPQNIHIPKGDVPRDDVEEECEKFEADYRRLRTDAPLEEALTLYLEERMRV